MDLLFLRFSRRELFVDEAWCKFHSALHSLCSVDRQFLNGLRAHIDISMTRKKTNKDRILLSILLLSALCLARSWLRRLDSGASFLSQSALESNLPFSSTSYKASLSPTERKILLGAIDYSPPHTFAVCAMIVDEAPFLEEWIVYHAAMGIQHFYLYEQGTEQNTPAIVAPFVEAGLVTLHRVSNQSREFMFQNLLLRKCFDDYGKVSEWVGHFDIDEFLVHKPEPYAKPAEEMKWPRETTLGLFFDQDPFRTAAGIHLSRHNFVNLAIESLDDQLVVQAHQYRRRVPSLDQGDDQGSIDNYRFSKSFAHTGYSSTSVAITDSHRMGPRAPFKSQDQLPPINEMYFNPMARPVTSLEDGRYDGKMTVDYTRMYLNHYMSRSREECALKAKRRQECCPLSWRAKIGEKWCDSPSFYIEQDAWLKPGQRWILDSLRHDPYAAQSFVGTLTARISEQWREDGIGHAWIKDEIEWTRVYEQAASKMIKIDYDLWDYYEMDSRVNGRPYGPPPERSVSS